MNKHTITQQLQILGLDDIEINIYLYLLEGFAKTPLEISRETGINRSKIYRYLERLKQKRLIEQLTVERGIKLEAASPEILKLLFIEKEKELKTQQELLPGLVKDLNMISHRLENPFEIRYYHGEEGLKQMLWNRLSAKEILLYGYQTMNEIVGKKFADILREEQVKRKIKQYEIEEDVDIGNFTGAFTYTDVPNWKDYYIPRYMSPNTLKIRQYTSIYNNTIAIMNWENGAKGGVEIVNELYAYMQKQLFWIMWNKIAEQPKQPKKS